MANPDHTDIDYIDCLFVFGHNTAATQIVLWSRMLDRLEGENLLKLIVVDPRTSATASKATLHLAPNIGTNPALINGVQHLLFKNGRVQKEYISKHTVGMDELRCTVQKYHPERVEQITGVPASQIRQATEMIREDSESPLHSSSGGLPIQLGYG